MRGHDAQFKLTAEILCPIRDLLKLAARGLSRIGLDRHGVEPGEILHHGIEFGGEIDRNALALRLHDLESGRLDGIFMRAIDVGKQEIDDDTLDIHVEKLGHGSFRFMLIKRDGLGTEQIDPAAHALHALARHEGLVVPVRRDLEAVLIGIAEIGLDATLELKIVFLAGSHDDAKPTAFALQEAVQHRGAGINAGRDPREYGIRGLAPLRERVLDGAAETDGFIGRRRLSLADDEPAGVIDKKCICHGAAGIHGHDVLLHRGCPPFCQTREKRPHASQSGVKRLVTSAHAARRLLPETVPLLTRLGPSGVGMGGRLAAGGGADLE